MTLYRRPTTNEIAPLFDPDAGECPPSTAVEFYLETPTSLGLLHTLSTQKAMTDYTRAVMQAWDEGVTEFLGALPDFTTLVCSPVTRLPGGDRVGLFLPGRIFVTRVSHVIAGGTEIARFHDHIYVGATGLREGQRWPLDFESLHTQMTGLAAIAEAAMTRALTQAIGAEWSAEPHPTTGFRELIGPALASYVDDFPRRNCPGDFEPAPAQRWNIAAIRDRQRPRRYRSA